MSGIKLPPDPTPLPRVSIPNFSARVTQPPEALQKYVVGQVLQGEVVGRNAKGLLEIQTAIGKLLIDTPQALAPGRTVTITVQQTGSLPQVMLQVLQQSGDKKTRVGDAPVDTGHPLAPEGGVTVKPLPLPQIFGREFPATLVSVPQESPATKPQQGAVLQGRVIGQNNGMVQIQTDLGQVEVPASQNLTPGKPVQVQVFRDPSQPPQILPEGTEAPVESRAPNLPRGYAPQTPNASPMPQPVKVTVLQSAMTAQNPPAPNAIKAEVFYVSPKGTPTLQSPMGLITINAPMEIETGQSLWLQLTTPATTPAPARSDAPLPPMAGLLPNAALPGLDEAMTYLRNAAPAVAQALQQTMQPGDKFAGYALLYLAALSGGDAKFLLGLKASREMDKSKPDIMQKLQSGFESVRAQQDSETQPWRHFPLPVFDGQNMQYAQFFVKNHGGQAEDAASGQRFVIEASLSRLGNMQLDGFIRADHFDLVMRTAQKLPGAVEQNIRQIFQDYMDLSGWNGRIAFQTTPDFPVKPGIEIMQQGLIAKQI